MTFNRLKAKFSPLLSALYLSTISIVAVRVRNTIDDDCTRHFGRYPGLSESSVVRIHTKAFLFVSTTTTVSTPSDSRLKACSADPRKNIPPLQQEA